MILLATRNQGKLKEYRQILETLPIKLIGLNDVPTIDKNFDVEETGKSYQENAILKATQYGKKANILTIADDSGLEIDQLKGQLGVYSGRFAQGDFKSARFKILKYLKNVPKHKRDAKFICTIALFDPKIKTVKTFTGESHGLITKTEIGNNGFGYDPIFYSLDLKKTYAESKDEEKNKVSHRSKAVFKLKKYLQKLNKDESKKN